MKDKHKEIMKDCPCNNCPYNSENCETEFITCLEYRKWFGKKWNDVTAPLKEIKAETEKELNNGTVNKKR